MPIEGVDRYDERDEIDRLLPGARQHSGLANPRIGEEARLDLARLDAIPAHFDLVVGPPREFERPVIQPSDEIAGAVDSLSGARRVREETARR